MYLEAEESGGLIVFVFKNDRRSNLHREACAVLLSVQGIFGSTVESTRVEWRQINVRPAVQK